MLFQVLDALTGSAILFLVALGLLVIFGVMKIINLAHGAFLTIGAYSALVVGQQGWSPWMAFVIAPLVGLFLGAIIEFVLVRRLYARPLDAILATWGLSIVVIQLITIYFGRGIQFVESPIGGVVSLGAFDYSKYRVFLMAVAVVLGLAVFAVTRYTRWGLIARAVILNEDLARALGINTRLVSLVTFSIGAALASFAGTAITPLISIDPTMGISWLINAFMIVLVAGTSVLGLALASILLGGSGIIISASLNPVLGSVTIVVLAVVILRILPSGFSFAESRG